MEYSILKIKKISIRIRIRIRTTVNKTDVTVACGDCGGAMPGKAGVEWTDDRGWLDCRGGGWPGNTGPSRPRSLKKSIYYFFEGKKENIVGRIWFMKHGKYHPFGAVSFRPKNQPKLWKISTKINQNLRNIIHFFENIKLLFNVLIFLFKTIACKINSDIEHV